MDEISKNAFGSQSDNMLKDIKLQGTQSERNILLEETKRRTQGTGLAVKEAENTNSNSATPALGKNNNKFTPTPDLLNNTSAADNMLQRLKGNGILTQPSLPRLNLASPK